MHRNLKELSEELIRKAKCLGATAAEAIVAKNKSLSIEVKNQNLEKIENSETLDLGIRVFINSKSACVSISSTNDDAINEMISRALSMAKHSPPDDLSVPAESNEILKGWNETKLKLLDKEFDNLNFEKLKDLTLEIEQAALDVKGISQCEGAGFGANLSEFNLTSSNGFSGGYKNTSFQLFCSAIAGRDSSMERDYASEGRTFLSELPDAISIGQLAANRAIQRLTPKKPVTGSYPVLFDQRVSNSLIGHLTSGINGLAISRGSSWLLNSLEKKVLPDNLTLYEDPTRPKIAGSRPFDGEGLMAKPKAFIKNGILKHYILDLRSARKLKLKPTGNAYRYISSAPQPGIGNLELLGGVESKKDLIQNIKKGILITSLLGSTINQNTGDYSRGASGFWIENGEVAFPINGFTIAGNLKDMLSSIIASDDGKPYLSKVIPSLLVDNMTVASR